jgi:hypothetical protein
MNIDLTEMKTSYSMHTYYCQTNLKRIHIERKYQLIRNINFVATLHFSFWYDYIYLRPQLILNNVLLATGSCCWVVWGLRSLNAAFLCWYCLSYIILFVCKTYAYYINSILRENIFSILKQNIRQTDHKLSSIYVFLGVFFKWVNLL